MQPLELPTCWRSHLEAFFANTINWAEYPVRYARLQWIDCKTCDAQIQWYCNEATIRFREARIAWVRLVVRSINKAVLNRKLRIVVRDTHRFRLDLQLVLNNILNFL